MGSRQDPSSLESLPLGSDTRRTPPPTAALPTSRAQMLTSRVLTRAAPSCIRGVLSASRTARREVSRHAR